MIRTKFSTSGIYKIQSVINKNIYIGSTVNFNKRKYNHIYKLKRKIHPNRYLQNCAFKYGIESLVFSMIEPCKKENLINREQYYINIMKPKFNLRPVAESNLGWTFSETQLQNARKANSHPIDQYSLDGNFIATYSSARYAGKQLKIASTTINASVNNRQISAGGFLWVRAGQTINTKLKIQKHKYKTLFIKVEQYSLDEVLINTYNSVNEAAKYLHTTPHYLSKCLHKKSKTGLGYKWNLIKNNYEESSFRIIWRNG